MPLNEARSIFVGVVVVAALTIASARGAVVINTSSQTNGTNSLPHSFTVSSTDLINGLAPTATAGTFTQEGAGGTPVLTNGTFTSPITRDGGGAFQFSAFATGGNTGGTSVTYALPTPSNITEIDVYGGWQDGGRDQQSYSILYTVPLLPAFFPLATVNFNPGDPAGQPQVTRVAITDNAGFLAMNVNSLIFNFNATENGYSGYAEIDVLGEPVPEPGSLGVLALGAVALLGRRRS